MLGVATAVADVPFASVRPLITPDRAHLLLGVAHGTPDLTIGAEPDRSLVWMHGQYWYQGEYEFAPDRAGTRVTYRIRNISGHPDAMIKMWQRRTLKAQDRAVAEFAAQLPRRVPPISG